MEIVKRVAPRNGVWTFARSAARAQLRPRSISVTRPQPISNVHLARIELATFSVLG